MTQTQCDPTQGVSLRQKKEDNPSVDPGFIAATTVIGNKVKDRAGKELGKIEEIMVDLTSGSIIYLVLSSGGILGIGDKFFAVPLNSLSFDTSGRVFYMDISREKLKKQPGFNKDDWPRKADWPLV